MATNPLTYRVEICDRAGLWSARDVASFADAIQAVRELRRPGKITRVYNTDRMDYDRDGLTDDERDALEDA